MSPSLEVLFLFGVFGGLSNAAVHSVKDVAGLGTFLNKQSVAVVEFYDAAAEGDSSDAWEGIAKILQVGEAIAVGRVPGSDAIKEKYEVASFPAIRFYAKGKAHGDDYEGDIGDEGAEKAIVAYARKTLADAQDNGIVKASTEVEMLKSARSERLCFKAEGLCAIYLSNGEASKDELRVLANLKRKNLSKLSAGVNARGTTWNWSWLDATAEPAFKALLTGDPAELPSLVLYNPHKRPRYVSLAEGTAATEETMQNLLDKVVGGDARFTPAKGQKLPTFAGKAEL